MSEPVALRVGMVSSFMPPHLGGLEVVAESLFHAYRAVGFDVRWIASRVPSTLPPRDGGRIRVNCWNGFEQWLGVPWPVWGPGGIQEVARLAKWADVVHLHDCVYVGSVLAAIFAHRHRTPILVSQQIGLVHYRSALLNRLQRVAYHTLGRLVLRKASHVVFCSPEAEAFMTTLLGGRPSRSSTIFNGIDPARFRPPSVAERATARQALGLPESKRVALFAGRLVEKKGVDLFLQVCGRTTSHHFLMVGDGPLRPTTSENLTWIPRLPSARMALAYQAADVLLLTSHSEAFPLVMKEAMASGVPVIASTGQPFTDRLADAGVCLVTARTPTAFSGALEQLRRTPDLAEALTARARALLAPEWDLERTSRRFVALIRELALSRAR